MDKIKDLAQKIKGGWGKIDKKRKTSLVLATLALVLFVFTYNWYNGRVTYAALFTNLDLQDAARITADLDAKNEITYRIENGGKDIYIDEKYVDKYRLDLAMNGMMPQNSTGFEIFDDMGMMVTDEDRKIMYQRALEGELQRSIMSISEIDTARVHLVMSEESIFDTQRRSASASVVVDVKAGAALPAESVKGIIALVSGAVNSLPEENVRVIDSSGNLLSLGMASNEQNSGLELAGQQKEIKSDFESQLKNNILDLLGPAFGPDKIKVSIYADLDFDAQEQTVISYENPVPRSEQKSASGSGLNQDAIMEDPIGDNVQNVLGGNGDEDMSSFDGVVNYELTESRTNTVRAPGKVTRISTSILYDGELTQEQTTSIRNLAATATGYDAARGDLINVEGVIFDTAYQEELDRQLEEIRAAEDASKTFMDRYGDYIFFGIFALLGLVLAASVLRVVFGRKKQNPEDVPLQPVLTGEAPAGAMVDIIDDAAKKFEVKEDKNEKQVKDYAKENPEIAADLIKAWMKD